MMINKLIVTIHTIFFLTLQSYAFEGLSPEDTDSYYDDYQSGAANLMPVYDSLVNVMKMDGTDVDCRPISDSTYYKCSDNSFFQPSNPFSKMLRKDQNGELVIDSIQSIVSSDGDILFNNRTFDLFRDSSESQNSQEGLSAKFKDLNNLKHTLPYADLDDPQFDELQSLVNSQYDEVLKKFETEKLNVTLENGAVLQCQKAFKNKKLSPEQQQLADLIPTMGKCGVYDCKKPGQNLEKKQDSIMSPVL